MWKKCDHCKRHHELYLNYNSENNFSSWADMMGKKKGINNKIWTMKTRKQPTISNLKKKRKTPCNNGPLFLEYCKNKNGYRRKIKFFQKLKNIEGKQLRIIINGYFCKVFEKLCFVIINGKKIQFIQNTDSTNLLIQQIIFPMIKKKPNFPQAFLFRNGLLELPVFQPNMLSSKFHFFRLESADSIAEKISTCLKSMVLMITV